MPFDLTMSQLLTELDPARALGLEEGDAHVIRNAGGRVTDALRSIIISQQLLGTREIIIVHHVCRKVFTIRDYLSFWVILTILDGLWNVDFHRRCDPRQDPR